MLPVKLQPYFITLLVVVLYTNTLWNKYALDDSIVLTKNEFVKEGIKGIPKILKYDSFTGFFGTDKKLVEGGRYRPLPLILFAFEYDLFGINPVLDHLINLLLYALLVNVVFFFCKDVAGFFSLNRATDLAFLTTVLFAVHPAHTEVVANIKGRDEILVLLFGIAYIWIMMQIIQQYNVKKLLWAAVFLLLGFLTKESMVVYLLLSAGLFICKKQKLKKIEIIKVVLFILISVAVYAFMRIQAIGLFEKGVSNDLMNNPFVEALPGQKMPTVLFILLYYLKLIFVPWPLTYDYYPYHIELQHWGNIWAFVSVFVHVAFVAAIFYFHKRKPVIAIAIVFYLLHILLVSNLFFTVGTFMNERFLFAPSLAVLFLIAMFFVQIRERFFAQREMLLYGFIALLMVLQSVLVIKRNRVWKDNFTLFTNDVKVSYNSAKSNCAAGNEWLLFANELNDSAKKHGTIQLAIQYLKKSIDIYPRYSDAYIGLGNAYYYLGKKNQSVQAYRKLLAYAPSHQLAIKNLKTATMGLTEPLEKRNQFKFLLQKQPNDFTINYQLGRLYGMQLQKPDSALFYLDRAYTIDSTKAAVYSDLGIAYTMNGNLLQAEKFFRKAIADAPADAAQYINLGLLLQQQGRLNEAQLLFQKAEQMRKR